MTESEKIETILSLLRDINHDDFSEQISHGSSLTDILTEVQFLHQDIKKNKQRISDIIDHISDLGSGHLSVKLPISENQDELDVISMGLNTFTEELLENAFSIKTFDELFNTLNNPFFIVNTDEWFLMKYNNASLNFFNYQAPNRYKINAHQILPDNFIEIIQTFFMSHQTHETLSLSLKKENKEQNIIIHLSKLNSSFNANNLISIFITDITAQVENEKLLNDKEVSEHSARMKEEFLANMSHEIRTPMNAILGLSKLMNKAGSLNDKQSEYLRAVNLNSHNLLGIINNILDYSKIESGKIELEERPFEINKEILATCESLSHNLTEKGLVFEVFIDEHLPKFLSGDSSRLNQILINLLSNAIKFTEQGKINLSAKLLKQEKENTFIEFTVKDTGIGIPEDKQLSIFDSFTQASSSTTRKYGGTGLGLAIVKKLVDLHRSEIKLKSSKEGSEFSFVFTYKMHLAEKPVDLSSFALNTSIYNLRILLVEDNTFNQMVATDTIHDWNPTIEIDVAENGIEALEKLKKNTYNLILMDIQMPEMDGHITTKIIRNEMEEPLRSIPIIAMTAHALVHEVEACFNSGMNDYISKPFEPEALFNKINKAINPDYLENIRNFNSEFSWQKQKNKIVDTDSIYSFTKGNKQRISKMINIFLNETPSEIQKLNDLFRQREHKALKALAHSLKPKMTYMGIPELSEIVNQIEIHSENEIETEKLIRNLTEKTEIAFDELKEILISC